MKIVLDAFLVRKVERVQVAKREMIVKEENEREFSGYCTHIQIVRGKLTMPSPSWRSLALLPGQSHVWRGGAAPEHALTPALSHWARVTSPILSTPDNSL
jgi:hypothetical protein